eukprot:GHVU01235565.1.p2 GENE.GHVU01235565.1~~GHVU01235565.1.p2  ORF type:complete len:100 (-),score=17.46 GHVU01235565.1:790-1089(-)
MTEAASLHPMWNRKRVTVESPEDLVSYEVDTDPVFEAAEEGERRARELDSLIDDDSASGDDEGVESALTTDVDLIDEEKMPPLELQQVGAGEASHQPPQ